MPCYVSIVIPAFNEESTILDTIYELKEYLSTYQSPITWEIIIVNDGSNDNTLQVLNHACENMPFLRVVDLGARMGRGMALRRGLASAKGEIVISLDADLSYAPYHIARMLEAMEDNNADLVLASAYGPGGTVINVPLNRLLLSKAGNLFLSFMFGGVSTLTCLARAYRRSFIEKLDLHSTDKDIHLEILYKTRTLGGKIVEVPADLCWRKNKINKPGAAQAAPKRRSTLTVRRTSSSHLFFALLNRPGIIFWIPGFFLLSISIIIFAITCYSVSSQLTEYVSLYQTIRHSMLNATPSWLTMFATFVLGIQFFTIGFITAQNKRNHEELYKTLNYILNQQTDSRKS